MDGIRIPSSRPVVVDSATILVPILKHSMNLEIDAVVSVTNQIRVVEFNVPQLTQASFLQ